MSFSRARARVVREGVGHSRLALVVGVFDFVQLLEVTFRHWLKNFNECWWDSWVLDVLVCNFGGMWVGMRVTKYCDDQRW